jgi:hypothetical protein
MCKSFVTLTQQTNTPTMKIIATETNNFGTFDIVQLVFTDVNPAGIADQSNFHECTLCNFKEVVGVDFKADFVSDSGSAYMYTDEGVYRQSDHWGYGIASCSWILDGNVQTGMKVGFAKWSDFTKYFSSKDELRNRNNKYAAEKLQTSFSVGVRAHLISQFIK